MLVDDVTAYIAVRRAAGYKVKALERYLSSFAHFATSQGDEYIVVQTAIDWAGRTTTARQAYLRLQQVILLARYCRAEDTRHQIPPRGVSPSYQRRPTRRRVLSCSAVCRTFRALLDACGIARHSGQSRPRLMDLRHTYATTVLLAGPGNRDHVGRHMLALSTAMGHSSIAATFWYLESTPALMNDIADACQKHIDGGSS